MKKVLLLLPGAFSGVGGIEMYDRQLVRAFLELGLERGFGVRTFVLNDRTDDVDDRYVPRGAESPRGFSRAKPAFAAAALLSAFADRPDLVVYGHLHLARLAPLVGAVSPSSRSWYVVHGLEAWQPLDRHVRRALARAERILAVSDYTRKELARNGGVPVGKIDLVLNTLDEVWQRQYAPRPEDPNPPAGKGPGLLTVARLDASERYKGVDAVLRALPAVAASVPGIRYDVVGDGDDRRRLEALAAELGVADRVRFRGRLWPDELAKAYRDCTVYVMPSSREGFGIVFLEAALFGKPSIGGRHGGTPEVVDDGVTGLLVEQDDLSGLARAIERVVGDGALAARMGAAARDRLHCEFEFAVLRRRLGALLAEAA